MAITSLDDIIAGVKTPQFFSKNVVPASGSPAAGRNYSYWSISGIPGPGSFDTTLAGVALSSTSGLVNGQIPYYNATATKQMHLARAVGICSSSGIVMICDRLWHNGGLSVTSTSAQTVNSATWPARDNNGSTNGEGILVGLEVSVATGTGTPTITLGYTNSAGTSGRTATGILTVASSSVAGTFYPIGLQAGDRGVRSIQTVTFNASMTSGTVNLVAYRVLAMLEQPVNNLGTSIDALTGGLPKLYDGTVPYIMAIPSSTTAFRIFGQLVYSEG